MSTAVLTRPQKFDLSALADTALKAATRSWFVVTLLSQLMFGFAVATFYGLTALRGDYHGWNFTHGFVPGITKGNWSVVMHVSTAAVIMLSGAVQLIPQVRSRFPLFHRWNGRIYMLSAVALSGAGLYMHWVRGSVGDLPQHLGGTLNAVLIWAFAGLALRYAMARDFRTHRRWALRLFLVVSASWFFRLGFFLILMIYRRPVGFDPATFAGPLPTFMSFSQYLIPLAILEIYFWAQDRPGALRRLATAGLLFVCTLGMVAGTFAVTMAIWVPQVRAGFDPRISVAETLSKTISTGGIDQAIQQYHALKTTEPSTYNFDESQLNSLGYRLIRKKDFKAAIRIFQLNIESFPKSSNAYDSLAEAYMDDGDKPLAIANYQKALELNPNNGNSASMMKKLTVQ